MAYYRFKYLTSERFDNVYITSYFREIDRRRAKAAKETVMPLTKKEQQIYVPINGGALSKSERKSLAKSFYKLATASVKLGTHMAVDYSLYWILSLISHHARYQSKVQGCARFLVVFNKFLVSFDLQPLTYQWRILLVKASSRCCCVP